MLADSGEVTILLPARTRYEQAGGGTQTNTERRLRYSPEIPGPRIGEARSEWEILRDLGLRALAGTAREAIDFRDAARIREEMDRVMPMYRGIAQLTAEGQSFQYGGTRLLEGGICDKMPAGRARFSVLVPPELRVPAGSMTLATRRGAQFNSIVFRDHDALTGSRRDEVFINAADAAALNLQPGDAVVLNPASAA